MILIRIFLNWKLRHNLQRYQMECQLYFSTCLVLSNLRNQCTVRCQGRHQRNPFQFITSNTLATSGFVGYIGGQLSMAVRSSVRFLQARYRYYHHRICNCAVVKIATVDYRCNVPDATFSAVKNCNEIGRAANV
jgi:hypothetical protein